MSKNRSAVMFAGQGKLDRDVLRCLNAVARSDADRRVKLALTIYNASLAAYGRMQHTGFVPHVLVGHGFGEIAALVAADAFTASDGADIVAARCSTLAREATGGYSMTAIEAPLRQVEALLALLHGGGVSVAAENSSQETVIVGTSSAVRAAEDLAAAAKIAFVPLKSRWAPHRGLSRESRSALVSTLRHVVQRPLQTPVFSPLRGRLYDDGDSLIECLAEQLAEPIRFAAAVEQLVRDGVSLVVESGPLRGLAERLDCDTISDTEFCRTRERQIA